MGNVTKKIDNLENTLKQLVTFSHQISQRLMTSEQSLAMLSKSIIAIIQELSEKKIVEEQAIMKRIARQDDEAQRSRVKYMVDSGVIKSAEVVDEQSLVVVSAATVKGETVTPMVEYFVVDMRAPMEQQLKYLPSLIGKKVGDKVETSVADDAVVVFEVKEIYEIVKSDSAK